MLLKFLDRYVRNIHYQSSLWILVLWQYNWWIFYQFDHKQPSWVFFLHLQASLSIVSIRFHQGPEEQLESQIVLRSTQANLVQPLQLWLHPNCTNFYDLSQRELFYQLLLITQRRVLILQLKQSCRQSFPSDKDQSLLLRKYAKFHQIHVLLKQSEGMEVVQNLLDVRFSQLSWWWDLYLERVYQDWNQPREFSHTMA